MECDWLCGDLTASSLVITLLILSAHLNAVRYFSCSMAASVISLMNVTVGFVNEPEVYNCFMSVKAAARVPNNFIIWAYNISLMYALCSMSNISSSLTLYTTDRTLFSALWNDVCNMSFRYQLIMVDNAFATKSFTGDFTSFALKFTLLLQQLLTLGFACSTCGSSLAVVGTLMVYTALWSLIYVSEADISTLP